MKKEEYMESKLSGIFRVKVVTKIYFLGPWGLNANGFCKVMSLFEETYKFFWTKLLHLSVFLVKQYTSLIYVKVILSS